MTYRFKPLPDITAYEVATLMANTCLGVLADDEQVQGKGEVPVPECLRRHFEKLPEKLPERAKPMKGMRLLHRWVKGPSHGS